MKNLFPVLLILLFPTLLIVSSCEKENLPPVASFTIDPASGNELTIFMFDASATTDPTDDPEDLMVMWDWEGDGVFDTQYSAKKTGDHKYAKPGDYIVTLVAKDPRGLTDTLAVPFTVSSSNLPPDPPFNPAPADGSTIRQIKPWMKWDSSDPEGDPLLFTCYFGTTNPPPQVVASQMFGTFTQGQLQYGTTYYWKIRVKDNKGHITEGPVWSFNTIDLHVSTITDARDGKTYNTIQIGEDWWTSENMKYDTGTGCYNYDDNPARGETYGKLYTWDAAVKACPEGWHLPTLEDFNQLVDHLGGADIAGGKLKDYETLLWREVNVGADNYSGFTALPAGRRYDQGLYAGQSYYAQFWSSTEYNSRDAYNLTLGYDYAGAFIYNYKKVYAISVRCVKN